MNNKRTSKMVNLLFYKVLQTTNKVDKGEKLFSLFFSLFYEKMNKMGKERNFLVK